MGSKLTLHEFQTVIDSLKNTHLFWAPVLAPKRGRFSDTDLLKYGPVTHISEIIWNQKTYRSAKEIVFPITQTLFRFTKSEHVDPAEVDNRKVVLICRSCDVYAIQRLDNIFLNNGSAPDPYYKRLREKLSFFVLECADPFDSCFCKAMGTHDTEDFSARIRLSGDTIEIEPNEDLYKQAFYNSGIEASLSFKVPDRNGTDVKVPQVIDMPEKLFNDDMWDEYSKRCIACGRCNTSCPTCSCFSVQDISYDDNPQSGERRRVWDGCHIDGFSDMAGGHSFRKDNGSRMRFKTFHKIYDYRKRFGVNMCVGCGRCDDVCPEYISFANCINKVTTVLEKGVTNG